MKVTQHGRKYQISYRIGGYSKVFTESFDTEAEAKLRAAEVEYAKQTGTLKPPNKREKKTLLTLGQFLDEYVLKHGLSKWGDSYYSMSVHRIEHYIKPYLGDRLLRDIDTQDLTDYYAALTIKPAVVLPGHEDLGKTISLSVIEKIHSLLRSAFNQAIAWGYITYNPAKNATYPAAEKKQRTVWTKETAQKAIELCDDPLLKIALLLAFSCSLRIGEIVALTWSDILITEDSLRDNSSVISVSKELKRCSKDALEKLRGRKREKVYVVFPETKQNCKTALVLKAPKTESSIRSVYVPNSVARELLAFKETQDKHKEQLGGLYQDYGMVLAQPTGRPTEARIIDRALERLIEDHALPKVVFHSTRHLATSQKLKLSGGDIKAVQGDNGQTQASMVTEVYSRTFDEDRKRLAELMEKAWFTGNAAPDTANEMKDLLSELQSASPEKLQAVKAILNL